jgi:transposase-like protein
MAGKRHKAEDIINKLRQADVELGRGKSVPAVCKLIGVTEATYYRWRREYGGMRADQAKRLKRSWSGRTPGSSVCSRTRSWTRRSCARPRRETSEPGPSAASRDVRPADAGRQ